MTKNTPNLLTGIDTIGAQPLVDRRREMFARALFEGMDVKLAYRRLQAPAGQCHPDGERTRHPSTPELSAA